MNSLQVRCIPCAIIKGQEKTKRDRQKSLEQQAREIRKDTRERKDAIKTPSDHAKEAQQAVNAFVRYRDRGLPCITCGTTRPIQWHAGHYLTRGAHPELALDPLNINRQCSQCNDHGSGRQLDHQKGILERYGQARLDYLEGPHEAKRYRVEDYRAIKAKYKKLLKELQTKEAA